MASPNFMDTPLVLWCQTFRPEKTVSYEELFDGIYLNQVMKEIDSKCVTESIILHVEDVRDRVHNWDILMKNINAYYKEVLQQMIVMKLPSIVAISKLPESDQARVEMTRVLLLVLGCAVQSESREFVIENIKSLEFHIQHAIMEYIKEITDDTKNVFAIEVPLDQMDEVSCSMFAHLNMLVQERDGYVEEIKELTQALEELYRTQQAAQQELQAQKASLSMSPGNPSTHGPGAPTTSITPEKHHMAVELAETKAKLRKLRQELEDKTEMATELQEELEELKGASAKLRTENLELVQDARAARTYRDEVDILKEKANRVDKYELEITRYKEKLNELEFYKATVEELREDNQVLVDTKLMLEEQLHSSHKRVEAVIHVEDDLIKYKQQVTELMQDREVDRQKMQQLLERTAQLEFEKKSSFNENANLEEELVKARRQLNVGLSTSISEQVGNSSNARILRLELEKQKLQQQLEELQENTALDSNTKLLELQKENLRLSEKVDRLQASSTQEVQGALELEQKALSLTREKEQLQDAIETVRETGERQIIELQRENEHLQQTVSTLRLRNEQTQDLRVKDIERENKRLHENVNQYNTKLSQLEFERFQLLKKCDRFEANSEKVMEFEEDNLKFEHENDELKKHVATLQLTCDKYEKSEQEAADLRLEKAKFIKVVDNLRATVTKLKALEQDNINLTVETQSLQRTIKTMKNSSSQLVNSEQEKHELHEQIQQLNRTVETYKLEHSKQEQLETNLYELDTENQKLQRSLEGVSRKLEVLQNENMELESRNSHLQKSMESSKLSSKRADELEKELQKLESENIDLHRSKDSVDKENKRIKQSLEKRDMQIDELTTKVSSLDRENKNLMRMAENVEDVSERLQESEQENMEMVRQSAVDNKTLATLREDFVSEKLKCQKLSNDLDKLNTELNKLGLNKERLMAAVQAEDNSKFKALESMLDDTFKKTMEIKEEKIHNLESRLNESMSRNNELQDEIRSVRQQREALHQRREEEQHVASNPYDRPVSGENVMPSPSATRDIMELKDHLISVERKNATLEAECQNQRSQQTHLVEQLKRSESQLSRAQTQISTFQAQNSNQQGQLAMHQVDNKTLQSQNASLVSQNSSLQKECSRLETEKERLHSNYEDLNSKHEDFLDDHAALQRLHEQVTKEYEELISEHGSLKSNHKSLKQAYEDQVDKNAALCRERQAVTQLKQIIEEDQHNMKTDNARLSHLQIEYVKLKEENVGLQNDKGRIDRKYDSLLTDHKAIKQEYNSLRVKLSDVQREYGECKDQLSTMDIEINKLLNKCESMNQMNIKLEEDNRALMMQLQALLTQNQELLVSTLESKDHFHEEQKTYLEKMADLRRQKEKLEEKIMEQFKRYDPEKKKSRSFGANLMRKARQMVSRNKSRERSKTQGDNSFAQDSAENSSLGSGSIGEGQDQTDRGRAKERRGRYRRGSSNVLANQNKALAKSTTALNLEASPTRAVFTLRGAKSSENLTVDTNRRSDVDSLTSNSDVKSAEWSSRPSRRRALMADSSSSNLTVSGDYRRQGSLSSEDTRSSLGPRIDIPGTPKKGRDMAVGNDDDDDDEDDDDGMISLADFLKEVDKSPKARRKYIKKQKEEEPDTKVETQTSVLSPTLGPRSPLVEKEDKKSPTKTKARNWKSELNISQLSRINSAGSAFTTFDRRHQVAPQYSTGAVEMTTPMKSDPRPTEQVTSTPVPATYGQSGTFVIRNSSDREQRSGPLRAPYSPDKQGTERGYSSERDRSFSASAERDRSRSISGVTSHQSPQAPVQRLFSAPGNPNTTQYEPRTSDREGRYMNGPTGAAHSTPITPEANRRFAEAEYHRSNTSTRVPPGAPQRSPVRPVSSLGIPIHQSPQQQDLPGNRERERSQTPSMGRQSSSSSIGSGSIGAYNAMTRQTSGGITPQRDNHHIHKPLVSGGRSLPRQPSNSSMNSSSNYQRPESLHRLDQRSESSQRFEQRPESSQRFEQRPESSQRFDQRPESSQRFDQRPESLQRSDQRPESSQRFDQRPESSQRFEQRPESSQLLNNSQHEETRRDSLDSRRLDTPQWQNSSRLDNSQNNQNYSPHNNSQPRLVTSQSDNSFHHRAEDSSSRNRLNSSQSQLNSSATSTDGYGQNNNKYSSNSDQSYIPGAGQRALPRPPTHSESGSGYPPPMRPQHTTPNNTDMSENYNPGNVRNLVQSYQQTQQMPPSPDSSGPGPVPPPRRTRPMSAGPIRPGNNSAFSVPPRSVTPGVEYRSTTPGPHEISRPHSAHPESMGGVRTLPQPPTDRRPMSSVTSPAGNLNGPSNGLNRQNRSNNGPNNGPPMDTSRSGGVKGPHGNSNGPSVGSNGPIEGPNGPSGAASQRPQSGPPGKPRNPVWYEYGCV